MPYPQNLQLSGFAVQSVLASAFTPDALAAMGKGQLVARPTATLPQTATSAIFTIATGLVLVTQIWGYATTAIGAVATTLKLQSNPTATGSSVDLDATVDANADVVGTIYGITGTAANAMLHGLAIIGQVSPIILPIGTIDLVTGSSTTGSIAWGLRYFPLEAGATIVIA